MAKISPTEESVLPGFLKRVLPRVEDWFGANHHLARMIRDCLDGGCEDDSLAFTTRAALDGLPLIIQGFLFNGWVPDDHPSNRDELLAVYDAPVTHVARVMALQVDHREGFTDDQECVGGDVRYVLRQTKAPVTVQILEGTSKADAKAMLGLALEWLDRRWEDTLLAAGDELLEIPDLEAASR
jgi:hypothetical protein